MTGIHQVLMGGSGDVLYAPPAVPVTPTPTGRYYTFTSSQPFTVTGRVPMSLVAVGGGSPGRSANSVEIPAVYKGSPSISHYAGTGGKGGVVNYQPSVFLYAGEYSVIVGGAASPSGVYGPSNTELYAAGGGPSNTNEPGTNNSYPPDAGAGGAGAGGSGSPGATGGLPQGRTPGGPGGAGVPTPWGSFGGGGGGGAVKDYPAPSPTPGRAPLATGGTATAGGGAGGSASYANAQNGSLGTANTGGGGGGGSLNYSPSKIYASGGAGGSGVVIIEVPNSVG